MFRALLITAAAAAGLLAAAPAPAAQAQPAKPATAAGPWRGVTRQTLPQAIAAIEKFSGGRVLEIRYRVRQGVPGFDAVVAKGGAFSRMRIDIPSNHVVVMAQADVPAWMANWVLKADTRSLATAKLGLADAVRTAEKIANAPAVDARLALPLSGGASVVAYDVIVIQGGKPQRVVIDAKTGQQIEDPQPLLQGWTPEQAFSESVGKKGPPPR